MNKWIDKHNQLVMWRELMTFYRFYWSFNEWSVLSQGLARQKCIRKSNKMFIQENKRWKTNAYVSIAKRVNIFPMYTLFVLLHTVFDSYKMNWNVFLTVSLCCLFFGFISFSIRKFFHDTFVRVNVNFNIQLLTTLQMNMNMIRISCVWTKLKQKSI